MATDQILTAAQAQAVYSAMCALNNAGNTTGNVIIPKAEGQIDEPRVVWNSAGVAVRFSSTFQVEHYADQAAFAAAYGLRAAPDTAVLLEALQAALAYNDSVMGDDGSGQFSWGPVVRAAIAQASA